MEEYILKHQKNIYETHFISRHKMLKDKKTYHVNIKQKRGEEAIIIDQIDCKIKIIPRDKE